jgi:hypothetical protein
MTEDLVKRLRSDPLVNDFGFFDFASVWQLRADAADEIEVLRYALVHEYGESLAPEIIERRRKELKSGNADS